ncbi:hypothetical protein ACH4TX_21490 [Streptomyces sp. NPDC021098]|uniref:hypothetical protein n=1 Tax=unclassified Streptomyces TaxID=2593676 RepID=UPI0037A02314
MPRRGLRIELIPHELHIVLICVSGVILAMHVGVEPTVAIPAGLLLSVEKRVRRI